MKNKKVWFIVIAIILIIIVIGGITVLGKGRNKKLDWSEIELGKFIPIPEKQYGKISINRSDLAMIDISKITRKEYKDYVQKCINNGYSIDLEYEPWDTVYGAFNGEGYSIRIMYNEFVEEMDITLEIPEKDRMKKIEWPTNGLGVMIPIPKSNFGNISWNNSETFIVHVGDMNINDYNEYVKKCEDKGFINNYSKSDKTFSAKNSEGYKLNLKYLGAEVIEISLKIPETRAEETTPIPTTNIPTTTQGDSIQSSKNNIIENTTSNKAELRREFKEAMDSYENFMNEYIAFMKKYKASNGTDMKLLTDYSRYISKYAEMCESFEKWETGEMNTAETAYYIDVQARVSKKLLEV